MPKHERPEPEDDADQDFMALIDEYGWAVKWIWDNEGEKPEFHYSAGIYELTGKPELFISGLNRKLGHWLINEYAKRVVAGETFVACERCRDFLEGADVIFLETPYKQASREHTTWTDWFYRRRGFPLMQLVWPDKKSGAFPWQPGYRGELKDEQEVLGKLPLQ